MDNDKKAPEAHIILVLIQGGSQGTLDDTGRIRTKSATEAYRTNYDNVFKKKASDSLN